MALKIRLRRMGRKKAPTYRIVVAESTMPRDGRFVANIGHYNPRTEPLTLVVDRDRALHWLGQGAIPTDTARSLLKRAGVFGPAPTVTEQATEAVREAADATSGRVKEAAASVAGAASAAAETVKEATSSAAEAVQDAASSAAGAVQETVSDAAENVREAVSGSDEAAPEAGDEEKATPAAE